MPISSNLGFSQRRPVDRNLAAEYVRKFGKNSNSFMTLYDGFEYFTSSNPQIEGVIAFIELPSAWIGGAEPFCEPQHWALFLEEFAQAAAAKGKSVVLIPTYASVTRCALSQGYGSILIGGEPTFDLTAYPKTGKTWIDIVPTAKILDSKGARVIEFDPASCPEEKRRELNSITEEWLASRKIEPLGFLNKVEPWTHSQQKRYFSIELDGWTLAFLAAIPIWPRNGWYLIDLLRKNEAPAGTTELLTLQAMKLLRESGALEVTFGVSPLALLDQLNTIDLAQPQNHPWAYPFLKVLYEKAGSLYSFKSLFQYKIKFAPTSIEPAFLVYRPAIAKGSSDTSCPPLTPSIIISVFQAFCRHGILRAVSSGFKRSIQRLSLSDLFKGQLRDTVVVRSAPRNWKHFLYRCKFTLTLLWVNLIIYVFTTEASGKLYSVIENSWGYSWSTFVHSPVHALALSPFLHWNLLHLVTNLILMTLFTGGLEYIFGTGITFFCYFVPMILSNLITSLILLPLGLSYPGEIDVGASLGIFGCAGALSWHLNQRVPLLMGLLLGTFIQALASHHWNGLNHWIAILLGLLTGSLTLKR